jgi:hypothetical protein
MKKAIAAICLVMVFALTASADKFYAFTLRDVNGNPYCDGLSIHIITAGGAKNLADGTHFGCVSSNLVGVKSGVSANLQYNATGAAAVMADPFYNTEATFWLVSIAARTWAVYDNVGGGGFLNNVGTWINGASPVNKNAKPANSR